MLQLTNGMANASSGSHDVPQLQQGCMSNSPNQLQQALLGPQQCSPTETDLPVVLSALHNNSTVLQLLPQASSTDAMPLILQMPGPADQGMPGTTLSAGMQFVDASLTNGLQSLQPGCMSQGYLQAPQQMVLVDTTSQLAGRADAGDNALQAQMQQLRAAVQQLNSQTAAVQQLLLTTQPGVPQLLVPVASNNMVTSAGGPMELVQAPVLDPSGQQCMLIPSGQPLMLNPSGEQYTGEQYTLDPSGQYMLYIPGQPQVINLSGQQVVPPVYSSSNLPDSYAQGMSSSSCAMDVSRSNSSASSLSTSITFGMGTGNAPSPGISNSGGSNQKLPSVSSPAAAPAAADVPANTAAAPSSGQLQILSAPAMPQPNRSATSCGPQGPPAAAGNMRLGRDGPHISTFGSRAMAARSPNGGFTRTGPEPRPLGGPCSSASLRPAAGVTPNQGPYPAYGAAGFRPSAAPMGRPRGGPGGRWPSGPSAAAPMVNYLGKYAGVPLMAGLQQLWSREALHASPGGIMFNVQQFAWQPAGEPNITGQDMYDFSKLKRVVQKLDAVHKYRVKLIKRIHGVAEYGQSDLKLVYQEVRSLIGEVLRESAIHTKSIDGSGVGGLVRLALLLQEALQQGRM